MDRRRAPGTGTQRRTAAPGRRRPSPALRAGVAAGALLSGRFVAGLRGLCCGFTGRPRSCAFRALLLTSTAASARASARPGPPQRARRARQRRRAVRLAAGAGVSAGRCRPGRSSLAGWQPDGGGPAWSAGSAALHGGRRFSGRGSFGGSSVSGSSGFPGAASVAKAGSGSAASAFFLARVRRTGALAGTAAAYVVCGRGRRARGTVLPASLQRRLRRAAATASSAFGAALRRVRVAFFGVRPRLPQPDQPR